ncbi:hypothetical protein O7626_08590 [Micromonospora sp. WMMD1102]|uniref:hypothetical protein n=1 Tax=Micromonospora sp. WMMD1102 TaxID=3016105 RepID=UPI002414EA3F|nr:hypothetical protein [Micromonospora sp. WMMD1102]MDG4785981.1 hypothetical protein [Micromonospora sp. WMMD1102]
MFQSLPKILDEIEAAGLRLVEMVLADHDAFGQLVTAKWWSIDRWLAGHSDDPRAPAMRDYLVESQRRYLRYQRRYLGWGIFVLRAA